jgi:hypothetical protein
MIKIMQTYDLRSVPLKSVNKLLSIVFVESLSTRSTLPAAYSLNNDNYIFHYTISNHANIEYC